MVLAWSSGCISHEETVYHDVERKKIEFENDAAARIFYEALQNKSGFERREETTTKFEIPVVFDHKRRVVTGDNWHFNEAATRCDTNGDGRITEQEARIFSELKSKAVK